MKHKLVILSDLYWDNFHRYLTEEDVQQFTLDKLSDDRYFFVRKYAALIMDEQPTLVLFAGDLTGDGSCGHGFHHAFKLLLLVLESQGVPSVFISGNHDEERYYSDVVAFAEYLELSQNINDRVYVHEGLRILGVPHATTKNKRKLKKLLKEHTGNVDIVLAHSESKRRPWLFDFGADIVATGHFDQKMTAVASQVFISLNNNWENEFTYATLTFDGLKNVEAKYNFVLNNSIATITETTKHLIENKVSPRYNINDQSVEIDGENIPLSNIHQLNLIDFRGVVLKGGVELMRKAKKEGRSLTSIEEKSLTAQYVYADFKFSRSMIRDYLG